MEVEQGIVANEIMTASAKQDDAVQRSKQDAHDANEVFYTEGSEELKAARIWIMNDSLPRSSVRVREAKRKQAELQEYIARKESKLKEDEEREKRAAEQVHASLCILTRDIPMRIAYICTHPLVYMYLWSRRER